MLLNRHHTIISSFLIMSLSGCGTYVPSIQEPPRATAEGGLLVRAIAESVRCQIQQAVSYIIDDDKRSAEVTGYRRSKWFEDWGVGYKLSITVEESSSLSPNLVWSPPSAAASVFTLGAGIKLSSTATRVETLNFFYSVKQLYAAAACQVPTEVNYRSQSFLVQDDLKFRESLANYVTILETGSGIPPNGKNAAFSQDVKFKVVSSGGISPAWKLSRLDINQDGSILDLSRDRTHEVSMTYGPIDAKSGQFTEPAAQVFQNQQLSAALRAD